MKKRYTPRKRYGNRRYKKRTTKRSSKFARRQQTLSSSWIRKKYTKVFTIDCGLNSDSFQRTISLIGGRNGNSGAAETITLFDTDQDV